MPKKLSTNSKAVEARERKDEKKRADQDKLTQQKEDARWVDDDKHLQKKANRKEESAKKKAELAERKAANKAAYDEEMGKHESNRGQTAVVPRKTTQAQIVVNLEKQKQLAEKEQKQVEKSILEPAPLEENLNRLQIEGEVASNVDDALRLLRLEIDFETRFIFLFVNFYSFPFLYIAIKKTLIDTLSDD